MSTIDDVLYMIHLAQEVIRPQDMLPLARKLVTLTPHLDLAERVVFSQAYHEAVGSLRQALTVIEPFSKIADTPEKQAALSALIDRLRTELRELCVEVIETADRVLLPASKSSIDTIFYNKMQADYWRYGAEFQSGEFKELALKNAESCYETAMKKAEEELDIVHPIRLGLILNYCVFLVDVKGEKEQGKAIAGATLERAEAAIAEWNAQRQDADICLKLLRDNCELWREEEEIKTDN
jgi:14-3-3 protein epsilon